VRDREREREREKKKKKKKKKQEENFHTPPFFVSILKKILRAVTKN